jgi:hypothetical protein
LPIGPLSIYVLRSDWRGEEIDQDAWRDVTDAGRTGSLMLRLPAGRAVTLYAADNRPLEPRVFDKSQDRISVRTIEVMPGFSPRGHLYRMSFGVTSARTASVLVALGGIPSRVVAHLAPATTSTDRATIFSLDLAGLLRTPDHRSELLLMARDEQSQLVGDGWSPVDFDVVGPYRWMTAMEAALVMPVAAPDPTHIRVQALRRADREGPASIALRINETVLPVEPIAPGWHVYEWALPDKLLRQGINELTIQLDCAPPEKTIAISDVRIERRN